MKESLARLEQYARPIAIVLGVLAMWNAYMSWTLVSFVDGMLRFEDQPGLSRDTWRAAYAVVAFSAAMVLGALVIGWSTWRDPPPRWRRPLTALGALAIAPNVALAAYIAIV
jgi:hypothetical protein